jgi:hypothetical protein
VQKGKNWKKRGKAKPLRRIDERCRHENGRDIAMPEKYVVFFRKTTLSHAMTSCE